MPTIFTCDCGARLKLPETAEKRKFRCPACSAVHDLDSKPDVAAQPVAGPSSCPICQTVIGEDEPRRNCPECDQAHHKDCWDEIGGCSIYGCPAAPAAVKEAPAAAPRSAWGDFKKCPACGEKIKAISLKCRYCDTKFDTVDPLTAKDLMNKARKTSELNTLRTMTIALFVLTLTGCLAPVTLIVGMIFFQMNKSSIVKAGPVFVVLAWATLGLAGLYSLLLMVFVVSGAAF